MKPHPKLDEDWAIEWMAYGVNNIGVQRMPSLTLCSGELQIRCCKNNLCSLFTLYFLVYNFDEEIL